MDEENLNNFNDNTNNNEPFDNQNTIDNQNAINNQEAGLNEVNIPTDGNDTINEPVDNAEPEDGEDSNLITLKDEAGNDVYFEFLDLIEYEGENYVILLPADGVESEEADEVVILKEDKEAEDIENGQESYVSVDDEDTLNKVFDLFKEKFKDEFNFVDDDNNN